MRRCYSLLGLVGLLVAGIAPKNALGDTVHFELDTFGGPLAFAPNSGASVPFELFVEIVDSELDGYDSLGLHGFHGDIITNTGIQQPVPSFSTTSVEGIGRITDDLWRVVSLTETANDEGFGMIHSDTGDSSVTLGDVVGVGASMDSLWRADVAAAVGLVAPAALSGVGIDVPGTFPDSGGNPFPFAGTAREHWYLLEGEVLVPDDPGTFTVSWEPTSTVVIRDDSDLSTGVPFFTLEAPVVQRATFSFVVTPEPASLLLLGGGGLACVIRRRRSA